MLSYARVAELADAYGSGPYGETRGGSSPLASSVCISSTLFGRENHRQVADSGCIDITCALQLSVALPSEPSSIAKAFFVRQVGDRLFSPQELFSNLPLFFLPPSEPSLARRVVFGQRV